MTNQEFIGYVGNIARNDWNTRHIMIPSVVIAQAIKESAWGKSELATNANALFGIKLNGWTGKKYIKNATEQLPSGEYVTANNAEWRAYYSWEQSILDHNDYINTRMVGKVKRYQEIIGNEDYEQVCELLFSCGYATSLSYSDSLKSIIKTHRLTQFDAKEIVMDKKIITLSAGHGLLTAGKRCMKKLDTQETREWWLNDRICDKVESILNSGSKFQVYRCDDTTGRTDVSISKRISIANSRKSIMHICVHHNAGASGGKSGGITVMYGSDNLKRIAQANRLYDLLINHTGLKGNRSKPVYKANLAELKKTNMAALYLELGYMDSIIDTPIILTQDYANKCAQAIIDFLNTEF